MKRTVLAVISCLWLALAASAKNDGILIKGQIAGYEQGSVQVVGGDFSDTLQVDAKGCFAFRRTVGHPQVAMVIVEQFRSFFFLYLENGMEASLKVAFHPEPYEDQTMYVADIIEYKGDHKDCFMFQHDFAQWERYGWPFEKIAQYDFPTYRRLMTAEADALRSRLQAIKSEAYRNIVGNRLDDRAEENVMRFAWAKNTVDPDFAAFMETVDRNDKANYAFAANYQRWYYATHAPEQGYTAGQWYMETLKRNFTNQTFINSLASSYMNKYVTRAPKDLEEAWQAYQTTCTNEQYKANIRELYEKYCPGQPAPAFELQGVDDGKTYTLSDFAGRALFIDCWATWCGPCMAEMPHFARLVEQFKGDSRIEFIGVSLDNNRQKLTDHLASEKPGWRQFWCPDVFQSLLAKNYSISGIPRFIFIGKDGLLISSDAPRPSSPTIVDYINSNL